DADVDVARANRLIEDPDRPHARGADLVDRLGRDLTRDPCLDLRLARGDLPLPGLQDLAVDDALDLVGLHLGPLERLGHRGASQIGGVEGRKPAAHLPEGGPGGGEDDRPRHLRLSSEPLRGAFPSRWSMLVSRPYNLPPLRVEVVDKPLAEVEDDLL